MIRTVGAVGLLLLASGAAHAQGAPCTDAQATRAEAEADSLRTWDALYRSYRAYRECDDGAIAEGYSESVARILTDHWSTLPRLARLAKKDDQFWHFVLDHIDASDDPDDLQAIKRHAESRCPAGLRRICRELKRAADSAIDDLPPEQSHAELR